MVLAQQRLFFAPKRAREPDEQSTIESRHTASRTGPAASDPVQQVLSMTVDVEASSSSSLSSQEEDPQLVTKPTTACEDDDDQEEDDDKKLALEMMENAELMQKGIDWFREHYPKEYMVLLD